VNNNREGNINDIINNNSNPIDKDEMNNNREGNPINKDEINNNPPTFELPAIKPLFKKYFIRNPRDPSKQKGTHIPRSYCNIIGCNTRGRQIIKVSDQYGLPGIRCCKHISSICSIPGCKKTAYRNALEPDSYGEAGPRCSHHYFHYCNLEGCSRRGYRRAKVADRFGEPGARCYHHYFGYCNVEGCPAIGIEFNKVGDHLGIAGRRCRKHSLGRPGAPPGCGRPGRKPKKLINLIDVVK